MHLTVLGHSEKCSLIFLRIANLNHPARTEKSGIARRIPKRSGVDNARYYSPRLGRFVSADTIIPGAGNPMSFDRYAYVVNNPLRFGDPSGHWPKNDTPITWGDQWWNPFSYDTVGIRVQGLIKEIIGSDVDVTVYLDMASIREGNLDNFEASINVEVGASLGLSLEEAFTISIIGTEGSVNDQIGIQAVGHDGFTVNASGCYILCGGWSGTYDEHPKNGETTAVSWMFGVGEGIDISFDLGGISDQLLTDEADLQIPVFNSRFWKKFAEDWLGVK